MQLQWTVIYFGFVSVCVSGQEAQGNLWKGGDFPAQGAAHRAQMLRCPSQQKEDSSVFLLQLKYCLEARTRLQGPTKL